MSVFPMDSADRRIAAREDTPACRYCGKPLAFIGVDEDNGPAAMQAKCWGRLVDHERDDYESRMKNEYTARCNEVTP